MDIQETSRFQVATGVLLSRTTISTHQTIHETFFDSQETNPHPQGSMQNNPYSRPENARRAAVDEHSDRKG